MLSLYERGNLAKDAAIALDAPSSSEFSLGYLVNSKEEVATVLEQAKRAGATATDSIHERPGASSPATSKILTVICGKSLGTQACQ